MTEAEQAKELIDDMLVVAEHIGFVCPLIALGASAFQLAADAGFVAYFRAAAKHVDAQRAAQTAGVAAAESQAATTAMERVKLTGSICRPCAETFAGLLAEGGQE